MRRMRYAALVLALALAACRDTTSPPPPTGLPEDVAAAVVGTWTLETMNGAALPWKEADGFECPPDQPHLAPMPPCVLASHVDVVGGTLTLNTSGAWSRTTMRRRTYFDDRPAVETSGTIIGTYTGSMATGPITLKFFGTGNNPFVPTWAGTMNGDKLALVGFAEPQGYQR